MHSGKTVFHALTAPKTLAALALSSILCVSGAYAQTGAAADKAAPAPADPGAVKAEIMQDADSTLRALSDKNTAVNENTALRESSREKSRVYRDPYGNRISAPVKRAAGDKADKTRDKIPGTRTQGKKTSNTSVPSSSLPASAKKTSAVAAAASASSSIGAAKAADDNAPLKVAVLYFSQPENEKSTDTDVLSGASVVVTSEGKTQGSVEHLARLAADRLKADVFAITRAEPYSTEHDELIYQAAEEIDSKARPEIQISPDFSIDRYDVILLGYPIWWYDLPMAVYSFMDQYDLSGKTIVPFCTHGGNRPFKTFALIAQNEPNAQVAINSGLIVNRYDVPSRGGKLVDKWLTALASGVIDQQYLRHFIKNHNPQITAPAPDSASDAEQTAAPDELTSAKPARPAKKDKAEPDADAAPAAAKKPATSSLTAPAAQPAS